MAVLLADGTLAIRGLIHIQHLCDKESSSSSLEHACQGSQRTGASRSISAKYCWLGPEEELPAALTPNRPSVKREGTSLPLVLEGRTGTGPVPTAGAGSVSSARTVSKRFRAGRPLRTNVPSGLTTAC